VREKTTLAAALGIFAAFILALIVLGTVSALGQFFPYPPAAPFPPVKAPAEKRYMILPPVEYDKHYDGDLTIKMVPSLEALYAACNIYNQPLMLACSWHNAKSCVIYLLDDEMMRKRGWNTGILLRHEIGHCNGWPGDHPGLRPLPSPVTHYVPPYERILK